VIWNFEDCRLNRISDVRFLVLGTGDSQVDLIRALKRRGVEVYSISYERKGRGVLLSDTFEVIDIKNVEMTIDFAKKNQITHIYSVGSDIAMPTIASVSESLGLKYFVPVKIAELMQDKFEFRRFLDEKGLGNVRYKLIASKKELSDWTVFPCIMKPVDSQGQRGVTLAESSSDLEVNYDESSSYSSSNQVIVEEFIDGQELSVNIHMSNAKIVHFFVSTRGVLEKYRNGIVSNHEFPASMNDTVRCELYEYLSSVIEKLGIENGPVYFQVMQRNDIFYIIEGTPRLDGCHLWRLIEIAHGVNILDEVIDHLIGVKSPIGDGVSGRLSGDKYRSDFFHNVPGSKFSRLDYSINNEASYCEFYYDDGQVISSINDCIEKVGYQIIKH